MIGGRLMSVAIQTYDFAVPLQYTDVKSGQVWI